MTNSWQNRALGRSRKEPVAALPASLAKFDYPYLYNNGAARYPPRNIAIIRGNYSQPKRNLYIPISLELRSKARYSAPLPKSPVLFTVLSQPTALAMTIARTAASYTPRLCSTVCRRVYAKSYVFVSVVCTCTHEERGCT